MVKFAKITRAQAEALVGNQEFFLAYNHRRNNYTGEIYCLWTGAKIYVKRAHQRAARFFVSGYCADGSDVDKVMDSLKAAANG